ncbi:hypothetical protein [Bacillus thuringiensis]|nr:hypothetical protein [Bacillus thuringiensis]
MSKMIAILLLSIGIIGFNGGAIHADKMEQQPKLKQELRMTVQDPGAS